MVNTAQAPSVLVAPPIAAMIQTATSYTGTRVSTCIDIVHVYATIITRTSMQTCCFNYICYVLFDLNNILECSGTYLVAGGSVVIASVVFGSLEILKR